MNRIEELLNSQEAVFNKSQIGRQVFEVENVYVNNIKTLKLGLRKGTSIVGTTVEWLCAQLPEHCYNQLTIIYAYWRK